MSMTSSAAVRTLGGQHMSRKRLVVVLVFLAGAAITGVLGFTDSSKTELKPVAPVPAVIAAIIALTGKRPRPKATFAVADWKGPNPSALYTLGTNHGFTPEQLDANRAGKLHPDQQEDGVARGKTGVRAGAVLLGIGAVALLLGLSTAFFPRALKDVDFTFHVPERLGPALLVGLFLGGLVGVLPLMFGFIAFGEGRRLLAAYRRGTVAAVEGELQKLVVTRSRSGTSHYYVIQNVRLAVSEKAWEAMHGGRYRAYYVPGGMAGLLSLEPR